RSTKITTLSLHDALPIFEDDADAVLVQVVDQEHEVLGRAVAARRGEVAGDLVAPRLVERVLHDRHELDMREAHPAHVIRQPRSEDRKSTRLNSSHQIISY